MRNIHYQNLPVCLAEYQAIHINYLATAESVINSLPSDVPFEEFKESFVMDGCNLGLVV